MKDVAEITKFKQAFQQSRPDQDGPPELPQPPTPERLERLRPQPPRQPPALPPTPARFLPVAPPVLETANDLPEPPVATKPFDPEQASIGKRVGSGAFGQINWLETDQAGMPPLVLKVPTDEGGTKIQGSTATKALQQEADNYRKAGEHPNIVKCYGIQTIGNDTGLVLEGIKGRNMADTMKVLEKLREGDASTLKEYGRKQRLSEEEFIGTLQYIAMQVLSGLAHLEEMNIVHNDIRPENIMIDETTGMVKIVDLGLAQKTGEKPRGTPPLQTGSVSPDWYMEKPIITSSHDTFALGEATRKQMEEDQFRYLKENDGKDIRKGDVRAFGAGAQTNPKQALNPDDPNAMQFAVLDRRAQCLLEKITGKDAGNVIEALAEARKQLKAVTKAMRALQQPSAKGMIALQEESNRVLKELGELIAGYKQSVPPDPPEQRRATLYARFDRLILDPVINTSATGQRLAGIKQELQQFDDPEADLGAKRQTVEEIETKFAAELDLAEATLRHSGEYGAATAYTNFINLLMHPDPNVRPSASQLLEAANNPGQTTLNVPFLADRLNGGDDVRSQGLLQEILGTAAAVEPSSGGGSAYAYEEEEEDQ